MGCDTSCNRTVIWIILQTAMSYCVVVSRFATESVLRVGGQGCGGLERQESQAETRDAQDAEIHRLRQTRWRRQRRRRRGRRNEPPRRRRGRGAAASAAKE